MRNVWFAALALAVGAVVFAVARVIDNAYVYFAGYVVLQYIVLATAWNILGGYIGYANIAPRHSWRWERTARWPKFASPPLPLVMLVGGVVSGLVGLLTGDLTLRLRGVFFCPEVTRRQL